MNLNDVITSTMPDGQPHINLSKNDMTGHINCSIRSPEELFKLLMVKDIMDRFSYRTTLNIHYLLGGRMDRAISDYEPQTLKVVGDIISSAKFENISVVYPHSQTSLDYLVDCHGRFAKRYVDAEVKFIQFGINKSLNFFRAMNFGYILPDSGAEKTFYNHYFKAMSEYYRYDIAVVPCSKQRDLSTGKLSGFKVSVDEVPETCIIVDDLCDGGGTFTGLAKQLRLAGAKNIALVVYHGVFSKGQDIHGIDFVCTSNSFKNLVPAKNFVFQEVV